MSHTVFQTIYSIKKNISNNKICDVQIINWNQDSQSQTNQYSRIQKIKFKNKVISITNMTEYLKKKTKAI